MTRQEARIATKQIAQALKKLCRPKVLTTYDNGRRTSLVMVAYNLSGSRMLELECITKDWNLAENHWGQYQTQGGRTLIQWEIYYQH